MFSSGIAALERPGRIYLKPLQDLDFCEEWQVKRGSSWPYAHGEVHPMLRAMVTRFRANLVPQDP
jgi:hypothetical protein